MEAAAAAKEARAKLDELFDKFTTAYAAAPERHRRRLRESFAATKYWATGEIWKGGESSFRRFSGLERDARDLRRALVLVSLMDGRNDTRDAITAMDDLIVWAKGDGIGYASIFKEVAAMSSPKNRWAMGSIRSLMEIRSKSSPLSKPAL